MVNEVVAQSNMDMSKAFHASGLFTDLKSEAQAVVKIQAGAELGVGAFAAMQGINVLMGKLNMASSLQATLIKRSGRYNFRVREHDEKHCKIEFFEKWDGKWESCGFSEFNIEDAIRAGLPEKNANWKKVPKNMVFARAISNGAKWFCADVFGGPVYNEADDLGVHEHVPVDNSGIEKLRASAAGASVQPQAVDVDYAPTIQLIEDTLEEMLVEPMIAKEPTISCADVISGFEGCTSLEQLVTMKDAVKVYFVELTEDEQEQIKKAFSKRSKELK